MERDNNWNFELSEYIKQGELSQVEKTKTWETAIGLQDVDGLKPSKYLIENVKEHIEGNIDLQEVEQRINEYYKVLGNRKVEETENSEEADKVAIRITEILSEKSFKFDPIELIIIHQRLFSGIYKHAGKIRDYNFTKKEWILNGESVTYASYESIKPALQYDFEKEREFSYKNLSLEETIKHLCRFTSDIWQIHPFCEGNTRTTAVFIIKYLRTFGFDINDDAFAEHSWYFRNALVRANYKKFDENIFEDISFLEKFFSNLLGSSNYELKNRYMHVERIQMVNDVNEKYNDCTLDEETIINIIKNNSTVKQEDIAKILNKSIRTIKTRMSEMQEKGLIVRKHGKRNGEWIVCDKNLCRK